jgi:hypothetical protein
MVGVALRYFACSLYVRPLRLKLEQQVEEYRHSDRFVASWAVDCHCL